MGQTNLVFSTSKVKIHLSNESKDLEAALKKTTHLGVGAHPDDLEIMAHHGIIEAFNDESKQFFGVTCSTGAGSARSQEFAKLSDLQWVEKRVSEQIKSATLGNFAGVVLLGYESPTFKSQLNSQFVNDLRILLEKSQPEVIYTHNPFDKHKTHVAVLVHLIQALRLSSARPKVFVGCEVWRGLDWLSDSSKVLLPVQDTELVKNLISCHESQSSSLKDYAAATLGRMKSNATFFDAGALEESAHQVFAIDLMPFVEDKTLKFKDFAKLHFEKFYSEVLQTFEGLE